MNKLFVITMLISIISLVEFVQACSSPIVYNEYGVPISIYGGSKLVIKASDYAADAESIQYTLKVKNTNSQGFNITFAPHDNLAGYVYGTTALLAANEQKDVKLTVVISGPTKLGDLIVTGKCTDGSPTAEGVIEMEIYGRGGTVNRCRGTIDSCGIYPDCQDLTQLRGCQTGYNVDYSCVNNQPSPRQTCSSYCCTQEMGSQGRCVSGVCKGPSRTINLGFTDGSASQTATVTLLTPGTNQTLTTRSISGTGSVTTDQRTVDLRVDYDGGKASFLIQQLNLTQLTSTTYNIVLDPVTPSISTFSVYRAYRFELPSGFSFSKVTLSIKYSDVQYKNRDQLAFYRCTNYNLVGNSCSGSWDRVGVTLAGDYAKADLTGFSVYSLAESTQTATTTTTQPYGGTGSGGGSSGGSGSGGGGSSGGGGGGSTPTTTTTTTTLPTHPTNFYEYPSSLELQAGSSKTFTAEFYSNYQPSLKAVKFNLIGVSSEWVTIEPSSEDEMFPDNTIILAVTISVPENATAGSYPLTLQAKSPSTPVRYEAALNLAITPIPVTTTTTTQPQQKSLIPTGLTVLAKGWPFILMAVGALALIKFYPREKPSAPRFKTESKRKSKGSFYKVEDDESPDYIRLGFKEPEPVEQKEVKKETKVEARKDSKMDEAKQRVIEEIRRRALKEDKKYR